MNALGLHGNGRLADDVDRELKPIMIGAIVTVSFLNAFLLSPANAQITGNRFAARIRQQASGSSVDLAETILGAKLKAENGTVIVTHVKRGGAAERSGIRPGDQLQAIEKHKITSIDDVVKVLAHYKSGHGLILSIVPKAAPRQLYVGATKKPAAASTGGAMLGVTLNDASGTVVAGQISIGGPAFNAGLRSGDKILAVDGQPVASSNQMIGLVKEQRAGDRVDLLTQHDGAQRTLVVTLEASAEVTALPKKNLPRQPNQQQSEPVTSSQQSSDASNNWVDDQDAEDIYNVNDRALYTDFD